MIRLYTRRTVASALLASALAAGGVLDDMGLDTEASQLVRKQEYHRRSTKRPPAQHSGSEGIPPLPLPAVPLRRTEKKSPPRPPVLIAKLATDDKIDWATSPDDTNNLLRAMASTLNLHFSTVNLPQHQIPADATEIPVIYRSGIRAFVFTDTQRNRLRSYLLSGGTLILNAYCGHPDFARSALHEMERLIPERQPYRLSGDHPLYRACHEMTDIRYRPLALRAGATNGLPSAVGIDINTRTAVFLFRYDLSTAWDNLSSDTMHIIGYEPPTAKQLGANLMAYVTAERNAAVPLSKALLFVDAEHGKSGKLAIAQARYNGLWRTRDTSLSMLLNVFHSQTQTPVRFAEETVDLTSSRLLELPLLYLTGTTGFVLTEAELQGLRTFLQRGGVLLGEASCGRTSFDEAFRREMGRVLPGQELKRLSPDHVIFQFPNTLDRVMPRPALARRLNSTGEIPPLLYGVMVEDRLSVIYSPYDLSGGWALAHGPYNEGLASDGALALGVNILWYALAH